MTTPPQPSGPPEQQRRAEPHEASPAAGVPPGPPPGYPGGYGYPSYPGYPVPRPINGLAIASLVLGIVWLWWLGSILALVFGYIARKQIRQRGQSGDGLAIAGIVLGWVALGFLVLLVISGLFRPLFWYRF